MVPAAARSVNNRDVELEMNKLRAKTSSGLMEKPVESDLTTLPAIQ